MAGKQTDSLHDGQTSDEKHIEQLIRLGGERHPIDPEAAERVRRHVHQVWRARQGSQERWFHWLFAAWKPTDRDWPRYAPLVTTMLLLMVGILGFYNQLMDQEAVSVADIDYVHGTVTYAGADLRKGTLILAGDQLHTGQDGLISLRLIEGGLIKLDRNTQIRFMGRNQIALETGGIYFDSESTGHIRIHTPWGTASDIGTQFETRHEQGELIVRVRNGQVKLEQPEKATLIGTGWSLRLAEGKKTVEPIPEKEKFWVWADAMDEHFSFDGRSMAEVLFLTARKEGWQLEYRTRDDEKRAQEDIVHGDLDTRDSLQLLQKLAIISDMSYRLQGQVLTVRYP